jgi:EpsD family peptidyl-prolyl cis-trans isomerase
MEVRWELAAGAAAVLFLGACGREATGQSVAVVNNDEISRGELIAELQRTNIGDGPQAELYRRQLLQSMIDRRLLAQQAVEEGVDRTPEFLMRDRQLREQLLVDLLLQRNADHLGAPAAHQIASIITENPGMFGQRSVLTLDQLHFDHSGDSNIPEQLKGAQSLLEISSTLNRFGIPQKTQETQLDTASLSTEDFLRVANLPKGRPFILPVQGGSVVSVIRSSRVIQTPPEDVHRLALRKWRQQQLDKSRQQQLRELRERARIKYQPGYEPLQQGGAAAESIQTRASR